MRLFPFARLIALFARRDVDGVMQPAVPGRRHARCFRIAVIDHPAPLEAERRIDLAPPGTEITVALFVHANQFAEPPGPQLRAKSLAVPPCEQFEQKELHRRGRFEGRMAAVMPPAGGIVQLSPPPRGLPLHLITPL